MKYFVVLFSQSSSDSHNIIVISIFMKPYQWCNGWCTYIKCGRSYIQIWVGQIKDYKNGIYCFSAKHAELRSKNKDWLARIQENVSEWSDMSSQWTTVSVS